tara:strand:- start:2491 stop:3204 length:714 start_codon:yes stop_codon:yes gene_type:complete
MTLNITKKRIVIIPARGGSKRIPGKNIREFCGTSMLELALHIALESNTFSKIVLSSDVENIINVGKKFAGVELHHRPANLSTDYAGITDLFRLLIESNKDTDYAYLLEPTSVFRNSQELKSLVTKFESSNACSFGTVSEVKSHPKKMFGLDKQGLVKNISTNGMTARSQDLESLYEFNGILYGVNVKQFLTKKQDHITFGKILGIETPRMIFDINNFEDFQMAEAWYYYDKKTIRIN